MQQGLCHFHVTCLEERCSSCHTDNIRGFIAPDAVASDDEHVAICYSVAELFIDGKFGTCFPICNDRHLVLSDGSGANSYLGKVPGYHFQGVYYFYKTLKSWWPEILIM